MILDTFFNTFCQYLICHIPDGFSVEVPEAGHSGGRARFFMNLIYTRQRITSSIILLLFLQN